LAKTVGVTPGQESTAPITAGGLAISIVDESEVDAWYERTADDRKPFVRDFPISRSEPRHIGLDDLRDRVATYASSAFASFRALTIATAATSVTTSANLARRLKRLADLSAPLIELRDDDFDAQKAIQRDATLWADENDALWLRQLRERFTEAQVKTSPRPVARACHDAHAALPGLSHRPDRLHAHAIRRSDESRSAGLSRSAGGGPRGLRCCPQRI
jgi:hypothetical protein